MEVTCGWFTSVSGSSAKTERMDRVCSSCVWNNTQEEFMNWLHGLHITVTGTKHYLNINVCVREAGFLTCSASSEPSVLVLMETFYLSGDSLVFRLITAPSCSAVLFGSAIPQWPPSWLSLQSLPDLSSFFKGRNQRHVFNVCIK